MNKTEKFIAALLLVNIALAGALHFISPIKPEVSEGEVLPTNSSPAKAPLDKLEDNFPPMVLTVTDPSSQSLSERCEWARQDPHAAMNWAEQQQVGDDRDEVLAAACFQIAREDPAQAVALAEQYALTNHGTMVNLAQQWAQKDLRAAYDWVASQPVGTGKDGLVERVGFVWATTEPADAARFVLEEIPPGQQQTEAAISILHQWALRDFDGANAWVQQFPEGAIRERALRELTGIQHYRLATGSRTSFQ